MALRINLREWRELRGMTQAALSTKAGIRQATISQIENGHSKSVSLVVLERLGRALEIHASQLFTDQKQGKQ